MHNMARSPLVVFIHGLEDDMHSRAAAAPGAELPHEFHSYTDTFPDENAYNTRLQESCVRAAHLVLSESVVRPVTRSVRDALWVHRFSANPNRTVGILNAAAYRQLTYDEICALSEAEIGVPA
jgi:hypothetical protein